MISNARRRGSVAKRAIAMTGQSRRAAVATGATGVLSEGGRECEAARGAGVPDRVSDDSGAPFRLPDTFPSPSAQYAAQTRALGRFFDDSAALAGVELSRR